MSATTPSRRETALLWLLAWILRSYAAATVFWGVYLAFSQDTRSAIAAIGEGLFLFAGAEFYVWLLRKRNERP